MIRASELRIGNLISFGSLIGFNNLICIINEIDEQGVVVKFQKNNELEWIDLFQFYPIPLTEEWLLKLPEKIIYPEWIKYLHELQNWYYWNNEKQELIFKNNG